MALLEQRLGHELAALAEAAKIELAGNGASRIDLGLIEPGLRVGFTEHEMLVAIRAEVASIVATAQATLRLAGLKAEQINALYFTGGSTGLHALTEAIAALFPAARVMRGDRFASVATGLGLYAQHWFARS